MDEMTNKQKIILKLFGYVLAFGGTVISTFVWTFIIWFLFALIGIELDDTPILVIGGIIAIISFYYFFFINKSFQKK